MVNESVHTCSENGQWLPSPYKIRCASIMCPEVKNVISSKGEGFVMDSEIISISLFII